MNNYRVDKLLIPINSKYIELNVRVWEPEQSHSTLFCLHGYTGNGYDFFPLSQSLVNRGFTIVAPDMPGRGRSAYLDDEEYSLNLFIRCVSELSRYRRKDNHILGTSWGAFLALLFLASTKTFVNRVILNDLTMSSHPELKDLHAALKHESDLSFDTFEDAVNYVKVSRAFMGKIPDEFFDLYVSEKLINVNEKYKLSWDPKLTSRFSSVNDFDLRPLVYSLQIPTLILYGRDSKFIDQEFLDKLVINKNNFKVINNLDCGHPPSLMTTDQILMVSGFLA